jgi:hypothetical protein
MVILVISLAMGCSKSNDANVAQGEEGKQPASGLKRYQVESGIVHYTTNHDAINMTGTEIVYFDNWGTREATFGKTEMNMAGMTQKTNTMNLWDGEWNYSVDIETNTGTKMKNPMMENLGQGDAEELGKRMLKAFGGEKVGTEQFLGKMCDVYETRTIQSKSWIWKGILLKSEAAGLTKVATKLEVDVPVDKKYLTLPAGAEIREFKM